MKKMLSCLVLVCLTAGLLCGCQTVSRGQQPTPRSEQKLRIGISFDTFVLERWVRERDVFVSTAEKMGAAVDVQNANGDARKQVKQIKEFIAQRVAAIVIIATDCYRLADVVKDARKQGIRIISYDRLIQGAASDLYITVDNEKVGRAMADEIKHRLPNGGNVVMICGPAVDTNSRDVEQAFERELSDDRWHISYKNHVKSWTPEYGFAAVNEAFGNVRDIDAVMCGNDGLAGYAIKALSELQKAGHVVVVGQDADLEACQRIAEGTQSMTVYKPIEELARVAAADTVRLVRGETARKLTGRSSKSLEDGTKVPYFGLDPTAVTKDNMDQTIIASGFHLKEEVYLNVEN